MPDASTLLLVAHATVGSLSLLFGALVLWAPRRRVDQLRARNGYLWATLAVAATALGLVALDPRSLWWLAPLALLTAALVVMGHLAPRRGWGARARAHGVGGAYVALVTATLVVSLEGPLRAVAWLLPTAIGVALIERWVGRLRSASAVTPPAQSTVGGAREPECRRKSA